MTAPVIINVVYIVGAIAVDDAALECVDAALTADVWDALDDAALGCVDAALTADVRDALDDVLVANDSEN